MACISRTLPIYTLLQIPGKENLLTWLYSGCRNISVASVNECGMSAFISPAQESQPPGIKLFYSNYIHYTLHSPSHYFSWIEGQTESFTCIQKFSS